MNDQNTVREFCEKHGIKLVDSNKRAHKFTKAEIKYFNDPTDYNVVYRDQLRFETEPLYTVEIAESELQKIADFESQVFNHMKQHGHYDLFNYIMEQKEREKYLKNKYPAVKKAYEQYSLILRMAESGEL